MQTRKKFDAASAITSAHSDRDVIAHVPWKNLLALFFASRVFIWLVGILSLRWVPKGSAFTPLSSSWDLFTRWDSAWYLDLARDGYSFVRAGESTNVVFFPLYPWLVRTVSFSGWLNSKIVAYVISFACLWCACVWLWQAVAREWNDSRLAILAVAFLLFGPVSFFFTCIYSEALFLPLAILCIDSARRDRWWLAGALGALAALTRFIGVALVVPLVWQYVASQYRVERGHRAWRVRPILACLLPLAGLTAYCIFMWVRFDDPLVYFHGQQFWGRRFSFFWQLLARPSFSGQPLFYQIWFSSTVVVAFGLLAVGVCLKVPNVYSVYGIAFGFIYVSARFVEGLPRYFSVIFPLYVVLALIAVRWPKLEKPLLIISASLLALSVILFVNGYWFT